MMHFPIYKGCKCSGKTAYFAPQPPKGGEVISYSVEFLVSWRLVLVTSFWFAVLGILVLTLD
jgi:hypothetical protein